jgi:hypothetical protein
MGEGGSLTGGVSRRPDHINTQPRRERKSSQNGGDATHTSIDGATNGASSTAAQALQWVGLQKDTAKLAESPDPGLPERHKPFEGVSWD